MDKLLRELVTQNFNTLDESQLNSIEIYLNGLQAKLNEAKRVFEANRKQEKWNKVREAIAAYVEAYGEIIVDDGYEGYCIDENYFFDECGRITNSN
jgi:hypothetical protein